MNQRKQPRKKTQTKKKKNNQRKAKQAIRPYITYKDRVFRMLFKDRRRLLELYNALNDTDYTSHEKLEVNTLDNAIFIKMKNDVSFVIDSNLCLYEHQSTCCPNMRCFITEKSAGKKNLYRDFRILTRHLRKEYLLIKDAWSLQCRY